VAEFSFLVTAKPIFVTETAREGNFRVVHPILQVPGTGTQNNLNRERGTGNLEPGTWVLDFIVKRAFLDSLWRAYRSDFADRHVAKLTLM
jgi:hypothetical protein